MTKATCCRHLRLIKDSTARSFHKLVNHYKIMWSLHVTTILVNHFLVIQVKQIITTWLTISPWGHFLVSGEFIGLSMLDFLVNHFMANFTTDWEVQATWVDWQWWSLKASSSSTMLGPNRDTDPGTAGGRCHNRWAMTPSWIHQCRAVQWLFLDSTIFFWKWSISDQYWLINGQ